MSPSNWQPYSASPAAPTAAREGAAEMDRAAVARDEGHELQAWLRERGAERALREHTRGLRSQVGAELAAEWIDRARGEVGL